MILIMATQTVIVEGVLESNGQDSSSSSIAGGSGGCISYFVTVSFIDGDTRVSGENHRPVTSH
jgi:hypothetical protein